MALTEDEKFRIRQSLARDPQGRPASAKMRHALEVDRFARSLIERQTPTPRTPPGPR